MKILLLGYGKEGEATEKYFKKHIKDAEIDIWQNFTPAELLQRDYSSYDMIMRSPSVPPYFETKVKRPDTKCSSVTIFFMEHCPCPVIGVTAGKGRRRYLCHSF